MEVKSFNENVDQFIGGLQRSTIAKTLRTINLLDRFGHELCMPYSKKIGANIFELRVRGVQEVRIFYTFHKGLAILLHGFIKKSQKTPFKELHIAQKRLKSLD